MLLNIVNSELIKLYALRYKYLEVVSEINQYSLTIVAKLQDPE